MNHQSMLKTGIVGSVITAICCFAPSLVMLLSALGFSALTGILDLVLIPLLIVFLAMTAYALWRRYRS